MGHGGSLDGFSRGELYLRGDRKYFWAVITTSIYPCAIAIVGSFRE